MSESFESRFPLETELGDEAYQRLFADASSGIRPVGLTRPHRGEEAIVFLNFAADTQSTASDNTDQSDVTIDEKVVRGLLSRLGDTSYQVRSDASRELIRLGPRVLPFLSDIFSTDPMLNRESERRLGDFMRTQFLNHANGPSLSQWSRQVFASDPDGIPVVVRLSPDELPERKEILESLSDILRNPNLVFPLGLSDEERQRYSENLRLQLDELSDPVALQEELARRTKIFFRAPSHTRTGEGGHRDETDLGMERLARLPNLRMLFLSHTGVSDRGLQYVARFENLQSLDLDSCTNITSAGLVNLEQLRNLSELSLCDTRIGDDGLVHIEELTGLTELRLVNAAISDAGLANLSGLTRLRLLSLAGNSAITQAGLGHLAGMHELRNLYLSDNPRITDAGLAHLRDLTNLRSLFLDNTGITDAGMPHLSRLTELRELYLSNNPGITNATLTHLTGLTNLTVLSLYNNGRITDDAVPHLIQMKHLEFLDLHGTGITAEGLAKLRQALPDCKFNVPRGSEVT